MHLPSVQINSYWVSLSPLEGMWLGIILISHNDKCIQCGSKLQLWKTAQLLLLFTRPAPVDYVVPLSSMAIQVAGTPNKFTSTLTGSLFLTLSPLARASFQWSFWGNLTLKFSLDKWWVFSSVLKPTIMYIHFQQEHKECHSKFLLFLCNCLHYTSKL